MARRRGKTGTAKDDTAQLVARLRARHLAIGWWSLFVFVTLGFVLEALHGFKVDWYLNVANQTRRLMWTLAHAHGTLLGLVHLGFGLTVELSAARPGKRLHVVSGCLTAATVLLPAGFFLGGIWIYDGDPGLAILLVPAGGLLLVVGLLLMALRIRRAAT